MTTATIIKKIRERIYQLQIAYTELCDSGLKDDKTGLKKLSICMEIDKLQTMLMAINEIW